MSIETNLQQLNHGQMARLIATSGRAAAILREQGVAFPADMPAPIEPEPVEFQSLSDDTLRGMLQASLQVIVSVVENMAREQGANADYNILFDALRQAADELRFSYTQVIFELQSLLPFWHGTESRSGDGSTMESTTSVRAALPPLLAKYGIRTVLDAGCGDFHWARNVDWGSVYYTGADIVGDIIAANRSRYAGPGTDFTCADIRRDELPAVDAVLCRDCLFHFSFDDAAMAIRNIRKTGAEYLLASTFPSVRSNESIPTGHFYPMNLQLAPYDFPEPLELIADAPLEKYLALWRFRDLRG